MPFNIISSDDVADNSVTIDDNIVVMNHTSVHPIHAPAESKRRIQLTWRFDFEGVTRDELLDLAAKHLVIAMRTKFKAADGQPRKRGETVLLASPDDWSDRLFSIRDYIDTEKRAPRDAAKEVKNLVAGMSAEKRAALLAQLQNM
jgi:hypothetical protein